MCVYPLIYLIAEACPVKRSGIVPITGIRPQGTSHMLRKEWGGHRRHTACMGIWGFRSDVIQASRRATWAVASSTEVQM